MNAVIIDDEKRSRQYLRSLIEDQYGEVTIVGEADGVESGVKLIEELDPDLLLLDVQMLDGSGFDLLARINLSKYHVIFVSAYDRFAIRAFKFSAIDYLLKPVDINELGEALDKVKKTKLNDEVRAKLDLLLNNVSKIEKIALASLNGVEFVRIDEIVRCESHNNYTRFYLHSGDEILVSRTLKDFEDMLESKNFFRIHKSHMINLSFLKKYIKGEGGVVVMEDGSEIPVSRRRKDEFKELFNNF